MSEKPSEYLKRTCLICGCHTNQTINIYEPRSGPNIVELIQAKFKFQPLNDDKYLCFSCNNWLINWHSLQALNSNDAESPSGTFRSHMNSMVQEKGAGSQQRAVTVCRPIAQVRPRQLENFMPSTVIETVETISPKPAQNDALLNIDSVRSNNSNKVASIVAKPKILNYSKRSFGSTKAQRLSRRYGKQLKSSQTCCVCGRAIVIRTVCRSGASLAGRNVKKSLTAKCRKCREVCKWRAVYLNSLSTVERQLLKRATKPSQIQNLVNTNGEQEIGQLEAETVSAPVAAQQNQSQSFPQPRVDGKVVSMLRRLGTTLSRERVIDVEQNITHQYSDEQQQNSHSQFNKLPPIMSPAKQKPRWTRQLESDEILLDFNTAISEVLPLIEERKHVGVVANEYGKKTAKRMLKYPMTNETLESHDKIEDEAVMRVNDNMETEVNVVPNTTTTITTITTITTTTQTSSSHQWNPLESFYSGCLPQGLSVSLI